MKKVFTCTYIMWVTIMGAVINISYTVVTFIMAANKLYLSALYIYTTGLSKFVYDENIAWFSSASV